MRSKGDNAGFAHFKQFNMRAFKHLDTYGKLRVVFNLSIHPSSLSAQAKILFPKSAIIHLPKPNGFLSYVHYVYVSQHSAKSCFTIRSSPRVSSFKLGWYRFFFNSEYSLWHLHGPYRRRWHHHRVLPACAHAEGAASRYGTRLRDSLGAGYVLCFRSPPIGY